MAGVALCGIRRVLEGMCVHDRLGRRLAVPLVESVQSCLFHKVSQEVAMSFRVAGLILCDIPCVSEGPSAHGLRGRKVAVSFERSCKKLSFSKCHAQEVAMLFSRCRCGTL